MNQLNSAGSITGKKIYLFMLFIYMVPVYRETREELQLFLVVSRELLSSLTLLHETSHHCQIYML